MNIGDPELLNELNELSVNLPKAIQRLAKSGRDLAAAEREYKIELAKESLRLKADGMAVTLIDKTVFGSGRVPDMRFKRDVAEVNYKTEQENINGIKLQMRLLEAQLDREWKS